MLKNILIITVMLLATCGLMSSCNKKPKAKGPSEQEVKNSPTNSESVQKETKDIVSQQQQTEKPAAEQSNEIQNTIKTGISTLPSGLKEIANDKKEPGTKIVQAIAPNKADKGPDQGKEEPNSNEPNKSNSQISKPSGPNEPNKIKTGSIEKVSFNSRFSAIFSEFVDSQGAVNYKKLKMNRNELRKDLEDITELDPNEYKSWPKEEQIALWINTYNLKMLNIIVDNYPIESNRFLQLIPGWEPDSIRHIDKTVGGIEKQKIIVMGEEFTLASIEEEIFYKKFNEPRCFFAISHLGFSGPPLRNEAYTGSRLNQQLDEQIKKYLSDPRSFKINTEEKTVSLPAILDKGWYGKYFVEKYKTSKKFKDQDETTAAVLNFLTNYLPAHDVSFLELQNYKVTYIGYNWRLKGK